MRIIAGTYKNREIGSPRSRVTHPMSEQIRGAIFNTLGDIDGLTMLDAFAGSGAIGFEAISRGALSVTFIESDKRAQGQIAETAAQLGVTSRVKLTKATVKSWSETAQDTYDVVVIDPPFHDLKFASVEAAAKHVATDGTVVLSWPGKQDLPDLPDVQIVKRAAYGDAQLGYYQ